MNVLVKKADRPLSITVICVLGFFGLAMFVTGIFVVGIEEFEDWALVYFAITFAIGLACMLGLWMMKKWAAYVYTVFAIVNQFILIGLHVWTPTNLFIPAIVIFFALKHAPRMT